MMIDDDKIQSALGLDVSCGSVTLFDSLTGHTVTIDNTRKALHSALEAYGGRTDMLAVCEATGGYEDQLLAVLVALAIPAHRADAAKVKAYIRSFGKRAKTDAIDARWLAQYGLDRSQTLVRWQPNEASQSQLQLLSARRSDLVAMRVQEKNRLKAPRSAMISADIEEHIAELDRRIATIEAQIETLIRKDHGLHRREKALRSIPGIGATIAALLIAAMPNSAASTAGRRPVWPDALPIQETVEN